jgi:hypothetical protein
MRRPVSPSRIAPAAATASLGVDLDAAVLRERAADHAPVLLELLRVARRAELLEQPRRPVHVGEQERDRAGRQVEPHGREPTTKPHAGDTPPVRETEVELGGSTWAYAPRAAEIPER